MRKACVAIIGAIALTAGSVAADDAKYGPAGCGLGTLLFKPDSGMTQILAATTNGLSANQTFAISSGTLNCDTSKQSAQSAHAFIQANREALSKDIARGSGETLAGLVQIAGCESATAVGASLQRQFSTIFPKAEISDEQVTENVMSSLRADKDLACHI